MTENTPTGLTVTDLTDDQVQALANSLAYSVLDVETSEELDDGAYAHLSVQDAKCARSATLALLQARADATAAQALIVERAVDAIDGANGHNEAAERRCKEAIRALAPDAGTAELAKLRGEIADLKLNMDADLKTMIREGAALKAVEAERDTLASDNARLAAQVERLTGAGNTLYEATVKAVGLRKHPAWVALRVWSNATAEATISAPEERAPGDAAEGGEPDCPDCGLPHPSTNPYCFCGKAGTR